LLTSTPAKLLILSLHLPQLSKSPVPLKSRPQKPLHLPPLHKLHLLRPQTLASSVLLSRRVSARSQLLTVPIPT
jgi:hypothetical protein